VLPRHAITPDRGDLNEDARDKARRKMKTKAFLK
jgi:hypothetical protein